MTPEIFTLCEGASSKNGQWCLLHTFNNYIVPKFPFLVQGVIVTQVRVRLHEEGDHKMELILTDPDGRDLWASEPAHFHIKMPKNCETFAYANLTALAVECYRPGQHDLRLLINGRELIATPLGISLRA